MDVDPPDGMGGDEQGTAAASPPLASGPGAGTIEPAPAHVPHVAPTEPLSSIEIPHHRQETDYTCGPAALRMVLDALWGIRVEEESLALRLGTDPTIGTRQRVMERFVQDLGLQVVVRHTDTTIQDVRGLMADGHIVLVCYWLEDEATDHYAVVVGIGDGTILLHDPWHGPDTELELSAFDAAWRSDPAVPTRRDRWILGIKAATTGG